MTTKFWPRLLPVTLLMLFAIAVFPSATNATHSWNGYHWARTTSSFVLLLGNNLTSNWQSALSTASTDWSKSTVLDTRITTGLTTRSLCRPVSGRVEVCNYTYGSTGWLGIAQIWISGTHVTQGVVKLNDTYFNTASYNKSEWRNFVTCQEVGHTLGLAHQDENFSNPNLGSCMDYTSTPSTNQHPNSHDYNQLVSLYSHLDSSTTVRNASTVSAAQKKRDFDAPHKWGKLKYSSRDGLQEEYELDLGDGHKVLTSVFWAD